MLFLVSRKTKGEMAATRFSSLSKENINTQLLTDKGSENTKTLTKQINF